MSDNVFISIVVDFYLYVRISIFVVCIVFPLACQRSLNSLRFTSSFSIIFVIFLTIVIIIYATIPSLDPCAGYSITTISQCRGDTQLISFTKNTLKILSIFIFGFTCHQNIFGNKSA